MLDSSLVERVRRRGWRITPQRSAVVETLSGDHVHLTADQVHGAARQLLPEISLATVYNTLNELVAMGEVTEVRLHDGTARYDPKVGPDHHHLVCQGCGLIFDVQPVGAESLSLPPDQRHGMEVGAPQVVFSGRCQECAQRS